MGITWLIHSTIYGMKNEMDGSKPALASNGTVI